jgi:hypothetical protein
MQGISEHHYLEQGQSVEKLPGKSFNQPLDGILEFMFDGFSPQGMLCAWTFLHYSSWIFSMCMFFHCYCILKSAFGICPPSLLGYTFNELLYFGVLDTFF